MNLENMNTLIDAVEKAQDGRHVMSRFTSYSPEGVCGTAYCIAGWACHLADDGKLPRVAYDTSSDESAYISEMRAVLELPPRDANMLALMSSGTYDVSSKSSRNRMERFDMMPAAQRKAAMLHVLRAYRDTGVVSWDTAIEAAEKAG